MSSKYTFIANQVSQHSIALLCRVLRVSRSGYYAWCRRAESRRHQANRQLVIQIRQVYTSSRGTYGSPRVHAELRAQGVRCSQKRVARIMRLAGIHARRPRQRQVTTDSHHGLPIAENVLQRDFNASTANRKWAADITYIPTRDGWLYLAVVMDLFSRRIIGWSMQPTLERSLVLDALEMAVQQRQPTEQGIHYSDRGSQYASGDYQAR